MRGPPENGAGLRDQNGHHEWSDKERVEKDAKAN